LAPEKEVRVVGRVLGDLLFDLVVEVEDPEGCLLFDLFSCSSSSEELET